MLQAARRDHERSAGHTLHLDRLSILEAHAAPRGRGPPRHVDDADGDGGDDDFVAIVVAAR